MNMLFIRYLWTRVPTSSDYTTSVQQRALFSPHRPCPAPAGTGKLRQTLIVPIWVHYPLFTCRLQLKKSILQIIWTNLCFHRIVPCATVLVRVSRAPGQGAAHTEVKGQAPQLEQLSPRLHYSDRVYYSSSARPTPGEARLLSAMIHRSDRPFNLFWQIYTYISNWTDRICCPQLQT